MKPHDIYTRFPAHLPLPFILDGSTGTALGAAGMSAGDCTEAYVLAHPDKLRAIQSAYAAAGSDAAYTATFGANAPTLARHKLTDAPSEINAALAEVSIGNPARPKFIGGDISPTGLLMKPYGDADFDDVAAAYHEQAAALIGAGVDFIAVETQISCAEARAAVVAIREISADIPVFVTLTLESGGRTMSGDALVPSLLTLADAGINAFGCNCSTGPREMLDALREVIPYAAALGIPVIAKPNAGMPHEEDGHTCFDLTPAEMYEDAKLMLEAGVMILGGCCGTNDRHIAEIKRAADDFAASDYTAPVKTARLGRYVSTSRKFAETDADAEYNEATFDTGDIIDYADDADEVLYLTVETDADADAVIEATPFISMPIAVRGNDAAVARLKRYWAGKIN